MVDHRTGQRTREQKVLRYGGEEEENVMISSFKKRRLHDLGSVGWAYRGLVEQRHFAATTEQHCACHQQRGGEWDGLDVCSISGAAALQKSTGRGIIANGRYL